MFSTINIIENTNKTITISVKENNNISLY